MLFYNILQIYFFLMQIKLLISLIRMHDGCAVVGLDL